MVIIIKSINGTSLKKKLSLSYLGVFFIPFLIITTLFKISYNSLENSAKEFTNLLAAQVNASVDEFTAGIDYMTKPLFFNSPVLPFLFNGEDSYSTFERVQMKIEIDKLLFKLTSQNPSINSVILLSNSNYPYYEVPQLDSINTKQLLEQSWIQPVLASKGELVICPAHKLTDSLDLVFTLGRKIFNPAGNQAGLLLINIKPEKLISYSTGKLNPKNKYNIRIIVKTPANELIYDSASQNDKHIIPVSPDNYLFIHNISAETGLITDIYIPKDQLYAAIYDMEVITFIAVALSLLFIVIYAFAFSNSITKPIKQLQQRMKQAEEGSYKILPQLSSHSEIKSLTASYNVMITKIRMLIEEVYKATLMQKNAEYLALQHQINPHILFNTLESIRMEAIIKKAPSVAKMVQTLADMFRFSLIEDKNKDHYIRDEVKHVETYIQLQNIRYDNQFALEVVSLDQSILDSKIIRFVFQPIVENSIIHGFVDYDKRYWVRISGNAINGDILLTFEDNGKGISEDTLKLVNKALSDTNSVSYRQNAKSIGLRNIAERIKVLYGEKYYVKLSGRDGGGTVVELLVPKL